MNRAGRRSAVNTAPALTQQQLTAPMMKTSRQHSATAWLLLADELARRTKKLGDERLAAQDIKADLASGIVQYEWQTRVGTIRRNEPPPGRRWEDAVFIWRESRAVWDPQKGPPIGPMMVAGFQGLPPPTWMDGRTFAHAIKIEPPIGTEHHRASPKQDAIQAKLGAMFPPHDKEARERLKTLVDARKIKQIAQEIGLPGDANLDSLRRVLGLRR
jgi:hypothetical protein